jgi:hypothetical protein
LSRRQSRLSGYLARKDSPLNKLAKPLDGQQPVCAVATFREVVVDLGENRFVVQSAKAVALKVES